MMTQVLSDTTFSFSSYLSGLQYYVSHGICSAFSTSSLAQVYSKVSGETPLETPTVDVSSKEFYGEGYDDSDKRIPDMTIINRQLGNNPSPYSIAKRQLHKAENNFNCWID